MPRISSTTSLLALLAALALTGPVAADEGHDHDAETAEAHDEAHGHDDDHGHGDDDDDHDHDDDHADEGDDAHAFEGAGVKVVHPWMNATSGREALIFFELENTGAESVSLSGAEVPFAEEAMLVGFALEGGEGTYQALPFVPVQPGRSLDLAPEGLAILASGLTRSFEEGTTASITLLTSAGEIALTVAVESKNARQHSHAGHNH
ncbi:copper chaperone PCu(A)C [Lacimonas salitolerans]|uniref:Copper chaperone PCu(A)C n=1 Tax=Lacimonas salitolerans TaxID=1323750 RepID=A0ABW4EC28_9RHOB